MKPALLIALAAFLAGWPLAAQVPGAAAEKSRIAGIVRAADTGEPLRRARVILMLIRPQLRGAQQFAVTGIDGRFTLSDVAPGSYRLMVERNGYVRQEYGQRPTDPRGTVLAVEAGRNVDDLEFRLIRAGVITGRVFDEEGEPVARVRIQVMRYGYEGSRRALATVGGESTNDLGEYRIFDLAPGRYYINATYRAGRGGGRMFVGGFGDETEEDAHAAVYYPGTVDPTRATPIELAPGQQLGGVDFTLVPSRMIRVRGVVTSGVTGQPVRSAQVWLLGRDSTALGFLARSQATTNELGRYDARVVTPGAYYLLASLHEDDRMLVGRTPVDVGTADVDDVNVSIAPGVDISGRVRVEGPGEVRPESLRIFLRPREEAPFFGGGTATVKSDASFQMQNIVEDIYSVAIGGAPEDFFLKAVRVGGVDVLESGLLVGRGKGASAVEIFLSGTGGRIEGLLLNEAGLPVTGTVLLVPPPARRGLPHLHKSTRTDALGRFVLRGIAPGGYKLFAFEEVEPGAGQDPEFLKPFEQRAAAVKVAESSTQSLELKVLPRKPAAP